LDIPSSRFNIRPTAANIRLSHSDSRRRRVNNR
jgi:hypothetical protein